MVLNVRTVLFCSLKQRLTSHEEFSLKISFLFFRFSNRVLFIKDVIGSNEICCWSFYGHGKKIAEVCCTAIVYATDRKNTKVREPATNSDGQSQHSLSGGVS